MTQSLIEICQDVLGEIGSYEVPATIVGSPNPTAAQILPIANREGRLLARRHDWTALTKLYTFSTVSGTAGYALPSDFDHFINDSQWDRTNNWQFMGPMTPSQWQALQSSSISVGIRKKFAIVGKQLQIYPTPTAVETVAFSYISDQWCESSGAVAQSAFLADTDAPLLSDMLIALGIKWRFMKEKGLPFDVDYAEYEREVRKQVGRDGGAAQLNMGGYGGPTEIVNIPETGFGTP